MRHHFAADFREAAQSVGDFDKAILIDHRDVARNVPAVTDRLRRFFRPSEVSLHHVRPLNKHQPRPTRRHWLQALRINDTYTHSRERVSDLPTLRPHLTKSRCAKIPCVHCNGGGALCAAISFQRTNAESVFEGSRGRFLKLLRADQYEF